jgi:hypothetical protein
MLEFTQWLQATEFFTYLRASAWTYPIILTLHMVGIAMFGGMVMLGNLRMLGVAMRDHPISDFIDRLRILKRLGLLLLVTCGVLLAGSKAEEYYYNNFFRVKMSLLLAIAIHSLVFRRTVYTKATELDKAAVLPSRVKLAAGLSLLLWIGVVICGRGIGYIEPPLDKLHASLFLGR